MILNLCPNVNKTNTPKEIYSKLSKRIIKCLLLKQKEYKPDKTIITPIHVNIAYLV